MDDILVRDPEPRDPDELTRKVWTNTPTWEPRGPELNSRPVSPEVSGDEAPTYLHPVVLVAAASGYVWFLLVSWVVFAGYGYMGISMAIATLISGAMLGLLAAGGEFGRNMTPWQRTWRSFGEFLSGEIDVWGARVSGWDAFVQLAGMAWCLAGLATAFGIIVVLARP
jgi:hypothetical protein